MKRLLLLLTSIAACGPMQVAPVKVEPIHLTIDVNVHDGTNARPATGDVMVRPGTMR